MCFGGVWGVSTAGSIFGGGGIGVCKLGTWFQFLGIFRLLENFCHFH